MGSVSGKGGGERGGRLWQSCTDIREELSARNVVSCGFLVTRMRTRRGPVGHFAPAERRMGAAGVAHPSIHPCRWEDIAGLDTAKRLLKEAVVQPLKYPQLFTGERDEEGKAMMLKRRD